MVLVVSLILLSLTFFELPSYKTQPEELEFPKIAGSIWESNCGNPSVFEKIMFYEDSICQYLSKNIYGKVITSKGIYRTEGSDRIGIRYFKGDRNIQLNYQIKTSANNKYYISEKWQSNAERFFFYKKFEEVGDKPSFKNSKWTHSCGNSISYEQLVFDDKYIVKYTSKDEQDNLLQQSGAFLLSEDGLFASASYDSNSRNFNIVYQIYQRESDGQYYILEKWNDLDLRYFMYVGAPDL